MDEVKITAQERFDLLDLSRLQTFIQKGFGEVARLVMGAAYHYKDAAGDYTAKRPLVAYPFMPIKQGAPSLTFRVYREFSAGGQTIEACVFDKDGYRVGGPNSIVHRDIVVPAGIIAIDYYLQVRRVTLDDIPEPRKFYDTSSGKTKQTVDTRTIDDYELQTSSTSADDDAALRDAGWLDVAVYQTNGVDDIVSTTAYPSHMWRDLLTWAIAPPAVDREPIGISEWVSGLRQIMTRMRYGSGGRGWSDQISNDAAFEEKGGFRWGSGNVYNTGLTTVYSRIYTDGTEVLTHSDIDAPAAVSDLANVAAKDFRAGSPTVTGQGYQYIGSFAPPGVPPLITSGILKPWPIKTNDFLPGNVSSGGQIAPWPDQQAALVHDCWTFSNTGGNPNTNPPGWDTYWNPGVPANGTPMYAVFHVPHGCQIIGVTLDIMVVANFPAQLALEVSLVSWGKKGGGATQRSNVGGGGFYSYAGMVAASRSVIVFDDGGVDTAYIIDNDETTGAFEQVSVRLVDTVGVAANNYIVVRGGTVLTRIREASHVY